MQPTRAIIITRGKDKRGQPEPAQPAFDKAYYDRFYRDPATRAVKPAAARRQAEFIAAYLRHLEMQVGSIIDMGCGIGTVLRALGRAFPKASTTGVELSEYLCEKHGWTQGSVVDYRSKEGADLVVCNDVLAYLGKKDCERAIRNLARLCHGALYLGVLTREDLELCDLERTDANQIARPANWYRNRLNPHFINVGGGLYLRRPLEVIVWSLDRL